MLRLTCASLMETEGQWSQQRVFSEASAAGGFAEPADRPAPTEGRRRALGRRAREIVDEIVEKHGLKKEQHRDLQRRTSGRSYTTSARATVCLFVLYKLRYRLYIFTGYRRVLLRYPILARAKNGVFCNVTAPAPPRASKTVGRCVI